MLNFAWPAQVRLEFTRLSPVTLLTRASKKAKPSAGRPRIILRIIFTHAQYPQIFLATARALYMLTVHRRCYHHQSAFYCALLAIHQECTESTVLGLPQSYQCYHPHPPGGGGGGPREDTAGPPPPPRGGGGGGYPGFSISLFWLLPA